MPSIRQGLLRRQPRRTSCLDLQSTYGADLGADAALLAVFRDFQPGLDQLQGYSRADSYTSTTIAALVSVNGKQEITSPYQ
jgi:hypothetical protein